MFRKLTTVLFCAVLLLFVACTEDDPIISEIDELTQIESKTTKVKNGEIEYSALVEVRILINELNLLAGINSSIISKLDNAENQLLKGKNKAAINILEALIKHVYALSDKKISKINADKVIDLLKLGILQIEGFKINVEILFLNPPGRTISNADGLTWIVNGTYYLDPTMVYAENYWGEYPLYFPGRIADIHLKICLECSNIEKNVSIVTESYIMNLDGSNGPKVKDPSTISSLISSTKCELLDVSFVIPNRPKGLFRFIAKIYVKGVLLSTNEAIFCPPDIEPIDL